MKKVLLAVLLLLLVLAAVMAVKTAAYQGRQVQSDKPPAAIKLDKQALNHLTQAVRIQTVSYDDTAQLNRAEYDSFFRFLHNTYAQVFEQLEDTVIAGRSLLLKWQGKNTSAKPVIFYAHLDVVPVEESTRDKWLHAPFSGERADGFIWGRGTLDDKGSLIALLEALKADVAANVVPERTIYFAFGSDEEVGGNLGAARIAEYFRQQHISFEFYVDEGGFVSSGMVPHMSKPVALIGTAEKGYVTLELTVNKPGGHSSRPAKKTALDVLMAALTRIHDNPEKGRVVEPVEEFLNFIGPEMPFPLKTVFANRWFFSPVIMREYEKSPEGSALLRTTNVTTVINAGLKENVIPTLVSAKVNFRVLNDETTKDVVDRITRLIGDTSVVIKAGELYEPSKNSSSDSYGFKLLQQTAAEVFPDAMVAPFLMLGSTDSKHFQDITENTYRFFPCRFDKDQVGSIHGINERIGEQAFMETITFYRSLFHNLK